MLRATLLRDLPAVPMVRLATGLTQGLVLCLLYSAAEAERWPATHGLVFAPLLLVAGFVPIIVLNGVGNMRRRSLLIWAGVAAVLLAALAMHDIDRGAGDADGGILGLLLAHQSELAIWSSPATSSTGSLRHIPRISMPRGSTACSWRCHSSSSRCSGRCWSSERGCSSSSTSISCSE